jgi:hypothetical protein
MGFVKVFELALFLAVPENRLLVADLIPYMRKVVNCSVHI